MTDLQAMADRVEIEALRGEFTDAVMMRDYDRLAALFTPDGAVRMPHIGAEATSRTAIRAGIEQLQGRWDYFVQNATPEAGSSASACTRSGTSTRRRWPARRPHEVTRPPPTS